MSPETATLIVRATAVLLDVMSDEQVREAAVKLRELADAAPADEDRKFYGQIAQSWDRLADDRAAEVGS